MNQQKIYYIGVNQGMSYLCDRCKVTELREDEYINNYMLNGCRYCDECRIWMKLQKYKCVYCNNEWSLRNERIVPKECGCGGIVVWLK